MGARLKRTIVGISGLPMLRPGLPVWRPANGLNIISVLGPCSPLATVPTQSQVAKWIDEAKALPVRVEY